MASDRRLEETRDVEPDVEANAVRGVVAHRPSDQNFDLPLGLEAVDEGFRLLLAVPLLEVLLDLRLDLFERNRAALFFSATLMMWKPKSVSTRSLVAPGARLNAASLNGPTI